MAYLKKETTLFERDEKGELLPVEVELEMLPDRPLVKIKPMTRGKLQEFYASAKEGQTTRDQDGEVILDHCIDPKFTADEIKCMKPLIVSAIASAIYALSLDIPQDALVKQANLSSFVDIKKKRES